MWRALLVIVTLGLSVCAAADQRVAYVGAVLIDPTQQPASRPAGLLLRDGRIERWLGEDEPPPQGSEVVRLDGHYIVPGLIDSHVHLTHSGERDYALTELRRQLYGGITAVRSMADDTRQLADLARATLLQEVPGPEVAYAALFAGRSFFNDQRVARSTQGVQAGAVPWMMAIDRKTDIRTAVTLARGAGASGVKIYANLPPDLVRKIIREAHRQNLQVWAHAAVFPSSPDMLSRSGVDSLSHICMLAYQAQAMPLRYAPRADVDESVFADGVPAPVRQVLAQMRQQDIVLDATNYVYQVIEDMRAEMPPGKGPPIYCTSQLAYALSRAARDAGVLVAAGTDAPSPPEDPYPALHQELRILVQQIGYSPQEALHAATVVGARILGRSADMGGLQPGMLANFVVLKADPLQDIAALMQIERVVKRGRVYLRDEFAEATP